MSYFKQDEPLLQLNCALCFQIFTICSSCYRGNRYCKEICSERAKKINNRRSNSRYRKTRKGKFNQAKRQNSYRKKEKVTDQSSNTPASKANSETDCSSVKNTPKQSPENPKQGEVKKDEPSFSNKAKSSTELESVKLCCIFCGRPSDYIIPLVKYQSRVRGPPQKSFQI